MRGKKEFGFFVAGTSLPQFFVQWILSRVRFVTPQASTENVTWTGIAQHIRSTCARHRCRLCFYLYKPRTVCHTPWHTTR